MRRIREKRPLQPRSQALVDAILGAATRVLSERSAERATTNEIAKVAGVSIGSLYQYFANKREVFRSAIEDRATRDVEALTRFMDDSQAEALEEVIRRAVQQLIEFHHRHLGVHRVLLGAVAHSGAERVVRKLAELGRQRLSRFLAARAPQTRALDPELAAFILGHAVEAVAHAAILERPELLQDSRLGDELAELCVRYLRP